MVGRSKGESQTAPPQQINIKNLSFSISFIIGYVLKFFWIWSIYLSLNGNTCWKWYEDGHRWCFERLLSCFHPQDFLEITKEIRYILSLNFTYVPLFSLSTLSITFCSKQFSQLHFTFSSVPFGFQIQCFCSFLHGIFNIITCPLPILNSFKNKNKNYLCIYKIWNSASETKANSFFNLTSFL